MHRCVCECMYYVNVYACIHMYFVCKHSTYACLCVYMHHVYMCLSCSKSYMILECTYVIISRSLSEIKWYVMYLTLCVCARMCALHCTLQPFKIVSIHCVH